MPGPEIPAIYPPLAELIFRLDGAIFQEWSAFKLPFVLADLLVVAMLASGCEAYRRAGTIGWPCTPGVRW